MPRPPLLPLVRFVTPACAAFVLLVAACTHPSGDRSPDPAPLAAPAETEDEPEPSPGQEGDDPPEVSAGAPADLPPPGAAGKALLAEADRELTRMRSSTYSHHARVDEAAGAFDYDCSGFLVYALSRAAPDALAAVQATTKRRPRSVELVSFLESIPAGTSRGRWNRVARVQDLAAGDVIVWLKPPESHTSNTGHTLLVRGPAVADPMSPSSFVVPIIDSTARPHGRSDPRSAERRTGLGRSEIVLVADGAGAPLRYRWSRAGRSPEKATTIALGRLR
jgi:hypothetical protein